MHFLSKMQIMLKSLKKNGQKHHLTSTVPWYNLTLYYIWHSSLKWHCICLSGLLTLPVSFLLIKSPQEASIHLHGDFKAESIKEVNWALIETCLWHSVCHKIITTVFPQLIQVHLKKQIRVLWKSLFLRNLIQNQLNYRKKLTCPQYSHFLRYIHLLCFKMFHETLTIPCSSRC